MAKLTETKNKKLRKFYNKKELIDGKQKSMPQKTIMWNAKMV